MVHAGDRHLREHELGRADDLLHAHRQVLDVVILALVGERELAEAADAEVHVGQPGPGVVAVRGTASWA